MRREGDMGTRRDFLKRSLMGGAGVAVSGCVTAVPSRANGNPKMRIGMAGYTYNRFTLDETLAALERFDIHGLCAKNFHFPYEATSGELKGLIAKCADRGVQIYAAGPISMNDVETAKRMFDYCAALGVSTMVGVPGEKRADGKIVTSRRLCETVSDLADKYCINFAIHNHGANPETGNPLLFPTCLGTYELVRDLGPRIGLCMDIAYTHADGYDPADVIRRCSDRIFDCHLRNIENPKNGSSGTLAWRGVVDYPSVFRTLGEVGYSGWCGLELANAFETKATKYWNPGTPDWIPLCLGYFRGVMDAM